MKGTTGLRLKLLFDAGDVGHNEVSVTGAVRETYGWPGTFLFRLDNPLRVSSIFVARDLLVIGIDMDPLEELIGTPRRPPGLPVLVASYRLEGKEWIKRFGATGKPPPATEFLGRGQLALEK